MADPPLNHHRRHDTDHRRLETPSRNSRRDAASSDSRRHLRSSPRGRSRSQLRARSLTSCDPDLERDRERVKMLEAQLLRERERLLHAEERRSASVRREREDPTRSTSHRSVRPATSCQREDTCRREHHSRSAEASAEHRGDAGYMTRSRSPSITKKDFLDIFNCLKDSLTSQPSAKDARSITKIDQMNILPNFDPSQKNQRIDVWLKTVNECASIYGWDDRTTTHFAMQKLQGLARTWYEGLNSVLYSWSEWQDKLINAFPFEQNYGQALEGMLKRKSRFNEPIEVYFYEKLTLLNQCDIVGKRAVECLIHGIRKKRKKKEKKENNIYWHSLDRTLRSGALALRCSEPDQLLQYLMSSKDSHNFAERLQPRNRSDSANNNSTTSSKPSNKPGLNSSYYNCKEKGHSFLYCPKPLIKCTKCNLLGHLADNCNKTDKFPKPNTMQKIMCIDGIVDQQMETTKGSKLVKTVVINNNSFEAFVDFGSDVTLLKESVVRALGLTHDNDPSHLKGLLLNLSIDGVEATVSCKVIADSLLEKPVLIGQSYTEQSHIIVYKDATKLQFIDIGRELPTPDLESDVETPLTIKTTGVLVLFGPASVRARVETSYSGTVLLKSLVAGDPTTKYLICGGLCFVERGQLVVTVFPHSSCVIPCNAVLCRAEKVNVVNRVMAEPSEIPNVNKLMNRKIDDDKVRVDDGVSADIKNNLLALLKKYAHCFADSLQELGCTNAAEMNIELNSERPVVYRPYRLSHHEREKVRSMIQEMLDAGIVRESVSQYASCSVFTAKV
ncbi:hypothetical protein ABMA28_010107 [Loxostege sticticalis]|uniref:CCHC-type domain-containing protein n=1 Tax=Loxostege sticticalis TaxID=481309 RepID=A0ABD0S9Q9_LOXSC